ncbi:MAG: FG-GAP repeat protein [Proteobacteria bacterium]|nr:FG-GAP repeat protein [Pseudomonadota bacterium]
MSIDNGIGNVNEIGFQDVSPAVSTTYTITAVGDGGTITDSVTVIVADLPPAPGSARSEHSPDTIRVQWYAPPGQNITAFRVYRRLAATQYDGTFITVSQNYYEDINIQVGTKYCYKVTAVTAGGEGPYSPETCDMIYWGTSGPNLVHTISLSKEKPVSQTATGDFNGDGYGDLILGIPTHKQGKNIVGKILVILGGGIGETISLLGEPGCPIGEKFVVTDLNNDNSNDIITTSPRCDVEQAIDPNNAYRGEGRVYVFAGSPSPDPGPDYILDGKTAYGESSVYFEAEHLGESIALAGDVNGDGFNDVVIGAPLGGLDRSGNVRILYGGQSLTSGVASINGPYLYFDEFGSHVWGVGDFNGDGYGDIRVDSSTSKSYAIYGGVSLQLSPELGQGVFSDAPGLLTSVPRLGDINHDGLEETGEDGIIEFGNVLSGVDPFTVNVPALNQFSFVTDWDLDGFGDFIEYSGTSLNVYSILPYGALSEIKIVSGLDNIKTYDETLQIAGLVEGGIVSLSIQGQAISMQPDQTFAHTVLLHEGTNYIEIRADSTNGTVSKKWVKVEKLPLPPLVLKMSNPLDGAEKYHTPVTVKGYGSNELVSVMINDLPATLADSKNFILNVPLAEGQNVLTVVIDDIFGQSLTETLNVSLVAEGSVKGFVTSTGTGLPIKGVNVFVTDSFGTYTAVTDEAGAYTVTNTVQGAFSITFTEARYFSKTLNSTVPVGGSVVVNTQLSYPLTINIIAPVDGAIFNSTPITVSGDCNAPLATTTVNGVAATINAGSRCTFTAEIDLPDGIQTITAKADNGLGQVVTDSISVTVNTSGIITGTITENGTGLPIAGAIVSVTDFKSNVLTATTAATGIYTINNVAAGAFSGEILKPGYYSGVISGNLNIGETVTVNESLDPAPPVISNIMISNVTDTSATVTWLTDIISDSVIDYGVTSSYGQTASDSALVLNHSVILTNLTPDATYHFRLSSTGNNSLGQSSADTVFSTFLPFNISNISVINSTDSAATITWDTDLAADSVVEYGLTPAYGQQVSDPAFVTNHSIVINGLVPGTTYHYRVLSTAGDARTESSADDTFTTNDYPVISNIAVTNITGNSATITWDTNQPASSQVDYGMSSAYGSMVFDSTLVTSHRMDFTSLVSGSTYHFMITSENNVGLSTVSNDEAFDTVQVMTLTITSPAEGTVFDRPFAMVKGMITGVTAEIGINVNGEIAIQHNTEFAANHIALQEGANTIRVIATDTDGNVAEETVNVTCQAGASYLRLIQSTESGLSPLTASFRIDAPFDMASADTNVYSMGPAGMDSLTFDDAENFTVQVSVPGIYYITAEVTDASSNVYFDAAAILVVDKVALDTLLKAKWDGMKSALAVQDVEGAVSYFAGVNTETFREIYTLIQEQLQAVASEMQEIEMIKLQGRKAEYRIKKNMIYGGQPRTITFYLYFIKESNGLWKILDY